MVRERRYIRQDSKRAFGHLIIDAAGRSLAKTDFRSSSISLSNEGKECSSEKDVLHYDCISAEEI